MRCSKTEGEPLADHVYQDGQCIYCGEIDPKITEYITAYIAYCGLTDAHSSCVEIMNAIYDAWYFAIFDSYDYFDVQSCFDAFLTKTGLEYNEALTALNTLVTPDGQTEPTGAQQLSGLCSFDTTIYIVVLVYYQNGTFSNIDSDISTAKEALQLMTGTYADYTGYNELRTYFSEITSCLEYCKYPTGSFNSFKELKSTYENNLRKYKNDLNLYF